MSRQYRELIESMGMPSPDKQGLILKRNSESWALLPEANSAEHDYNEFIKRVWICPDKQTKIEPEQDYKMALVKDMIPSSYLKQEDVAEDTIVTVQKIGQKNIAKEGDPPDTKWLVKFSEFEKPMVLNTTNIQGLANACGSQDTDDWRGKEVIIYVDPNVSYGGKVTGGLRIRRNVTAAVARKSVAPSNVADDIPF